MFSSHISSHSKSGTPAYATSLLATMPGSYNDRQVAATELGRAVLIIGTRHSEAGGSMYSALAESSEGYRVHMHAVDCKNEWWLATSQLQVSEKGSYHLAAPTLWYVPSTVSSPIANRRSCQSFPMSVSPAENIQWTTSPNHPQGAVEVPKKVSLS